MPTAPQPHTLTIRVPPTLSPPSTSSHPTPQPFTTPPLSFLQGTWHVTHSTLPMWRKNRNVEITYTLLPSSKPSSIQLADEVAYYAIGSTKRSTVVGIDTACGAEGGSLGAFNWRGKGLLRLVSSHWEVLGWGYAEGGERSEPQSLSTQPEAASDSLDPPPSTTQPSDNNKEEDAWMITWFGKTVFTPAGIDVYARTKAGHAGWVVEKIREALAGMEEEGMRKLGGELFEVVRE